MAAAPAAKGGIKEYKVVVLGSGGVGKSALTIRLMTGSFLVSYDPTIEDSYRKQLTVDDELVMLDILDTAGQDDYVSMHEQWMREGKGFLLVYSITNRASYDEIVVFREKILRAKEPSTAPIVLVGNKCDLVDQRKVPYEEARRLAEDWKCPFLETSAKDKVNNEEIFLTLVREIITQEVPPDTGANKNKKRFKLPGQLGTCMVL